MLDHIAQTFEFLRSRTACCDTLQHRRGVAILIQRVGDCPIHQQVFKFFERKTCFDLAIKAPPSPNLSLAKFWEQQLAKQNLIEMIAT